MSKSLGNVLLVRDLLKEAPGEAIRFALLGTQYRKPLDWSHEGLLRAQRGLDRLYGVLGDLADVPVVEAADDRLSAFEAALDDDLNLPAAIAELYRMAKAARRATSLAERAGAKAALLEAGAILGLLRQSPESWFSRTRNDPDDTAAIEQLVAARQSARAARDYAAADRIRGELAARGVTVEDRSNGPVWRRTG